MNNVRRKGENLVLLKRIAATKGKRSKIGDVPAAIFSPWSGTTIRPEKPIITRIN